MSYKFFYYSLISIATTTRYYPLNLILFSFFLISKERRQTLRDNIDIPTSLAPQETSILSCQTLEILLKKGGKLITKEGGLGQNPQENRKEKKT